MNSLSIEDFELFLLLAGSLSVAASARERNVSTSQVSRALTRIEAACAARLFHRSTHGLSLTAEGQLFLAHAQQIVGDARALAEDLSSRSEEVGGRVRVSVSAILAEHVLVPALGELVQLHPELQVSLNITDRIVDLANDAVDVAIRAGTPPRETHVARRLGGHRRRLYASPGYLASHGVPRDLAELQRHRLISNSAVSRQNQWHFVEDGRPVALAVRGQVQADNTAAVVALAVAGLGIARINDVVAARLVDAGRLQPVLEPLADPTVHEIHAITLAARHRAARTRATMIWLERCFGAFGAYR